MQNPRLRYADLDDRSLEKVHSLEEQMGTVILVMEKQYPVAKLSAGQLERIQALEQELGLILIAYQP